MTTEPPVYDLHNHPGLKFYRSALRALEEVGVPYVVGGAYAFSHYASIARETKDFDIFIHPRDVERALAELRRRGCTVATGVFGADMKVELVNDGPFTVVLDL